ncbi:MAG: ABC transporter permease [Ardenticatenaceae bacterium]|nr:ABC transporter permease [Ardenticatenaceae bacterium]HBY93956.1 ABC transporter permease [Chloroflexota bacterium]
MDIRTYVAGRVLQMIPVILLILVLNFFLIHLAPGDPALIMAGEWATDETVDAIREKYALDQPLMTQLGHYLLQTLKGDLGYSYDWDRPVIDLILTRIPATLLLVLTSQGLGITLGIVLGVIAARYAGTGIDAALTLSAAVLYSLPVFWLGLMMIVVFGIWLKWFPTSGMMSITGVRGGLPHIVDILHHLILPAISLMLVWVAPTFLRISRSSMIEVMHEEYITTARAKGLKERVVFFKHGLRNALLPSVTIIGLNLSLAMSGALLTETVFSWPGMGRLMFEAIFRRDYPLLMGIFLFSTIMVLFGTLLTDMCYRVLDPRLKLR